MPEFGLKNTNLFRTNGFIGDWCDASSGKTYNVVNPATGKDLATMPDMDAEDATRAVNPATDTLQSWKQIDTTP
ncbi:MAG: aldehyde dehydrogenase family protein [Bacteroidetes bacterium]|nr:aldehyde dehydrogenase family protein [Bacteroidota bacterium]